MKRTRETIFYQHPATRDNISGATFFDGEDMGEEVRRKQMAAQQKQWIQEQIEEKNERKRIEKERDQ
jgi:hypothetical protein